MAEHREGLDLLEESYTMARCGPVEYGEAQAMLHVETAGKALEVLRELEERVLG